MISKPIITIDKFNGMSVGSNTLWLDGFSVEDNGKRLAENYLSRPIGDFSDMSAGIMGMDLVRPFPNSNITGNIPYVLTVGTGSLYMFDNIMLTSKKVAGLEIGSSQGPDIKVLNNGDIIISSSTHLAYGVRGLCKTTANNKIVDNAGRDLSTLGLTTNSYVTNLVTGQQYKITGISTTNSSNDTLEFTAEASTNTKNDEFIAIISNKYELSTSSQFVGQPAPQYWARPIRQWGDQSIILNGNYLALLSADGTNLDKNYKQLPDGYQALAVEVGKLDDILVSAYDRQGIGYLLYWDGFSDGWSEVIRIGLATNALHPYENGWVYLVDGSLYFTDGRSVQLITSIAEKDTGDNINTSSYNSITSVGDKIYLACNGGGGALRDGVYVFDKSGFTFVKTNTGVNKYSKPYSLKLFNTAQIDAYYRRSFQVFVGCERSLNILSEYRKILDNNSYRSVVLKIDLKQETQIKEVWLNLQKSSDISTVSNTNKSKVSINIGDGSIPFMLQNNITQTSTTIFTTTGTLRTGNLGEEIEVISGSGGATTISGERFFITDIQNKGTNPETWTVEPALSDNINTSVEVRTLGLRKGETKEVSIYDLSKPIRFNVNFFGSVLYLEILTQGTSNSFPISISDIQLF